MTTESIVKDIYNIICDIADDLKSRLNKVTKELKDSNKKLELLTIAFEEHQKYVYICNYRINKYKKHLIISGNLTMCDAMHKKLNTIMFLDGRNPYNVKNQDLFHDKLDIPHTILSSCVNMKDLIHFKLDTLILVDVSIVNFELLRDFRGTKLYIINCNTFFAKLPLCDFENDSKYMGEQFKSFSPQLVNLTELVYIYGLGHRGNNCGGATGLTFNNDFFKKLKSLKKFVTNTKTIALCDSYDIKIEFVDYID